MFGFAAKVLKFVVFEISAQGNYTTIRHYYTTALFLPDIPGIYDVRFMYPPEIATV